MTLELPRQRERAELKAALRMELLALLKSSQNADGGWGFRSGGQSRVEPTSWAVRALLDSGKESNPETLHKAVGFMQSRQLADGSWPAAEGMNTGSWVTSLSWLVLGARDWPVSRVAAGLKWLCDDFPRDSSPWRRLLVGLRGESHINSQNDSYRGWGWTPRTSSWVEPTAFALIALLRAAPQKLPVNGTERCNLAIALLYDRMCPRGGWNCGNPRVYGVDGEPLVLPTCWALMALRDTPEKPERALSLAWLAKEFATITSPGSLAVARMTLESYGIEPPQGERNLLHWTAEDLAEQGTHILAWVSMALDSKRTWPAVATKTAEGRGQ